MPSFVAFLRLAGQPEDLITMDLITTDLITTDLITMDLITTDLITMRNPIFSTELFIFIDWVLLLNLT